MMPLTHQKQSDIFERIARDKSGRLFRVRFVVVLRDGILRGKIISCTPIFEIGRGKDRGLRIKDSRRYLPCAKDIRTVSRTRFEARKNLSPFSRFDFLTVIKIRAPSKNADLRG